MSWTEPRARAALERIFAAAVAAADPLKTLAAQLPERPARGRIIVLGAGKSAAVMAQAVEAAWPDAPLSGLVVTRYGHSVPTQRIEVAEAAHPVPDAAGAEAAARILALAQDADADDLVLFLVSGGGSSLTTLPAPGLTLDDLIATNRALLDSGATIQVMNCIRRHLSAFTGGRLAAAAAPAKVVTLAISDVPGDDPATIASGPTVPDPTTFAEARDLVARYRMRLPERVTAHLAAARDETPKHGTPDYRFIATPQMALLAAAEEAREQGLVPLILGDALEGEAAGLGLALAGIARSVRAHGHPVPAPCVLLSGGETTVTIGPEGAGRGGRNTECLLAFAVALAGTPGIHALMADTDGIDGTEDAAGAVVTPAGLADDARAYLARHDSFGYFATHGGLIRTGPTLTNVNDLRAILVV
ncbi:glycerate kinase type-2 family protein [Plastoroseomonas arctica]|uniref:Glycerate kinase n=1 Tax=Plastoroseomonas arctica TaxID=1509237 RepID=A0AAF1JZP4_9PROT|nr:glycerate kinase [Plastoroseomonas arctica]MBR0654498.1 glycerate kinase [Plastoroseomonas arctica]